MDQSGILIRTRKRRGGYSALRIRIIGGFVPALTTVANDSISSFFSGSQVSESNL